MRDCLYRSNYLDLHKYSLDLGWDVLTTSINSPTKTNASPIRVPISVGSVDSRASAGLSSVTSYEIIRQKGIGCQSGTSGSKVRVAKRTGSGEETEKKTDHDDAWDV